MRQMRIARVTPDRTVGQPIKRCSRDAALPLSFAQQRLWFLDQLLPNTSQYNVPSAVRLSGQLDLHALSRTLNEIVRRHEALRTTFAKFDGQPVQIIAPELDLPLPLEDLSALPSDTSERQLQQHLHEEAQRPFDLSHGPLIRARLLRLAKHEHVLALTLHHVVSDGWSMAVLIREFVVLYAAFLQGRPSPLPELAIQYADFARWQRQRFSGAVLEEHLDYWREQLAGAPELLSLSTDRPRPPTLTFNGAAVSFSLSAPVAAGLNALAQRHNATLFMALTAAFQLLLARHSGQDDICIGTPIANRNRAEIEPLIGCFVNTLVLRARIDGRQSFEQLLDQVRTTALAAYAHQDLPFETLVDALNPQRSLNHTPLFQVMFSLQNLPFGAVELPGLTSQLLPPPPLAAKFDLTLNMSETPAGLLGSFNYNTDLFDPETIERLIRHFSRLLDAILEHSARPLADLDMLEIDEREQLLCGFNDTRHEFPVGQTIPRLFEAQVRRAPEAPALVYEGHSLTYAELNERANALAHYLIARGVGPEVLVGLCLERSVEMVIALLAILKAGGAYVPLDPSYPSQRLAFMLQDSRPALLLSHSALASRLPEIDIPCLWLNTQAGLWNELPRTNPTPATLPGHLAYVIYTSGSTGTPKGVIIEHRSLVNHINWQVAQFEFDDGDIFLQRTSPAFDAAGWEIWTPLCIGAQMALLSTADQHDPRAIFATVSRHAVTILQVVPSLLGVLPQAVTPSDTGSLRYLFCGGEPLSRELLIRAQPLAREGVVNLYGPTEVTIDATAWCADRHNLGPMVSIGRPIANTTIYLLDKHGQPVPLGVAGELYIGGAGLARGYLNRPNITAERFIPDPFGPAGSRLYRTGDVGRYRIDGNIEFLGRVDQQVKIRGFRIELGEIEATLAALPNVREAAVLAREDNPREQRLVAYLVPAESESIAPATVRESLRQSLPEYMVPAHIVVLERLPLTPNGKLDRKALPAPDSMASSQTYVAPRTAPERALADLWKNVLRVPQVGIHDNFFELGGHSLLATQIITKASELFQISLPLRVLFESPTIAQLSATLDQQKKEASGSPVDRQPSPESESIAALLKGTADSPPVFCLHALGGRSSTYFPLASALGEHFRVYALQAPEHTAAPLRFSNLEEMARAYSDEIRRIQPDGPYRLLGWSAGGLLALEVASQLERDGDSIAYLGLIDTSWPTEPSSQAAAQPENSFTLAAITVLSALRGKPFTTDELAAMQAQLQADDLTPESLLAPDKLADATPFLARWAEVTPEPAVIKTLASHIEITHHYMKLMNGSRNYNINTRAHLILASASAPYFEQSQSARPDVWTKAKSEVIEGDHYSVLRAPQAEILAERIRAVLNDITTG